MYASQTEQSLLGVQVRDVALRRVWESVAGILLVSFYHLVAFHLQAEFSRSVQRGLTYCEMEGEGGGASSVPGQRTRYCTQTLCSPQDSVVCVCVFLCVCV